MNYKSFAFFMVVFILFSSCATTKIFFDDTIPLEETAIIQPTVSIKIIEFNGKKVNWSSGDWGTEITIPSGEANLTVSVAVERGNYFYTGGKLKFTYDFKKGQKYYITCKNIYIEEVEADIGIIKKKTEKTDVIRAKSK
ncbi:hypothetical protein [Treponema sp. R80B11-R83G3]